MALSMQRHKYAMLMVNEATSYTWVQFMAQKSQASDLITAFILQQERKGNIIQTLRTDFGGEFVSADFQHFLRDKGIILHAILPPYTPQFQGKVERMNRTVGAAGPCHEGWCWFERQLLGFSLGLCSFLEE